MSKRISEMNAQELFRECQSGWPTGVDRNPHAANGEQIAELAPLDRPHGGVPRQQKNFDTVKPKAKKKEMNFLS